MALTLFVSTVPSGKTRLKVGLLSVVKSVAFVSSTVTTVVEVTPANLPPRLTPALNGSFMSIMLPGLTITPLSTEVEKLTISDSFCSANNIARPSLAA